MWIKSRTDELLGRGKGTCSAAQQTPQPAQPGSLRGPISQSDIGGGRCRYRIFPLADQCHITVHQVVAHDFHIFQGKFSLSQRSTCPGRGSEFRPQWPRFDWRWRTILACASNLSLGRKRLRFSSRRNHVCWLVFQRQRHLPVEFWQVALIPDLILATVAHTCDSLADL